MNKYGYKERRILNRDDLRRLCIAKDWYTKGTNKEYMEMFKMTEKENITTDDIVEIVTDIMEHSETEYEFTDLMFMVARICVTVFEETE